MFIVLFIVRRCLTVGTDDDFLYYEKSTIDLVPGACEELGDTAPLARVLEKFRYVYLVDLFASFEV